MQKGRGRQRTLSEGTCSSPSDYCLQSAEKEMAKKRERARRKENPTEGQIETDREVETDREEKSKRT